MEFQIIISLLSLIALEVILGIDNVVFITILANKLPKEQQKKVTRIGLILAAVLRIGLLFIISIIMQLEDTLFTVFKEDISAKDLILILGGLFLMYKSTKEIYEKMETAELEKVKNTAASTFMQVIVQILIMDLVFSIDSVITAVGMVKEVWVMYVAIITTVVIMLFAAKYISNFVNKHPAFKMLALSFLLLIGFSLIGEGLGLEIPKGYIYFAMAFSLLVDIVQMKINKNPEKAL